MKLQFNAESPIFFFKYITRICIHVGSTSYLYQHNHHLVPYLDIEFQGMCFFENINNRITKCLCNET